MLSRFPLWSALLLTLLIPLAQPAEANGERVILGMEEGIVSDMLSECLEAQGFVLVDRGMIMPEVQARGISLGDLFDRQDVAVEIAKKLAASDVTRVVIVADVKAWQSDVNEDLGYETWRARIRLLAIDGSTGDELVRDQNEDKESRSGSEKARDAAIRRTMHGICKSFAKELREKIGNEPPRVVETPVQAVVTGLTEAAREQRAPLFVNLMSGIPELRMGDSRFESGALVVDAVWPTEFDSPEAAAEALVTELDGLLASQGLQDEFTNGRVEGNRAIYQYQLPSAPVAVVVSEMPNDAFEIRGRLFIEQVDQVADYQMGAPQYDEGGRRLVIDGEYGGSSFAPADKARELLQQLEGRLQQAGLAGEYANGTTVEDEVHFQYVIPRREVPVELVGISPLEQPHRGPAFVELVRSVPNYTVTGDSYLQESRVVVTGTYGGDVFSIEAKAQALALDLAAAINQQGFADEFQNPRSEGGVVKVTYKAPARGSILVTEQQLVHLVVDASKSMADPFSAEASKFEMARQAAGALTDSVSNGRFGLRVYGAGSAISALDRNDTQLLFGLGRKGSEVGAALRDLKPKGLSLLAYALEQGAQDMVGSGATTMVVLTDGQETSGGDPLAMAAGLQQAGIKLVVVSLAPVGSEEAAVLGYLAQATGGELISLARTSVDQLGGRLAKHLGTGTRTFTVRPETLDGPVPQKTLTKVPFGGQVEVYTGTYTVDLGPLGVAKVRVKEGGTTVVAVTGTNIEVQSP